MTKGGDKDVADSTALTVDLQVQVLFNSSI